MRTVVDTGWLTLPEASVAEYATVCFTVAGHVDRHRAARQRQVVEPPSTGWGDSGQARASLLISHRHPDRGRAAEPAAAARRARHLAATVGGTVSVATGATKPDSGTSMHQSPRSEQSRPEHDERACAEHGKVLTQSKAHSAPTSV